MGSPAKRRPRRVGRAGRGSGAPTWRCGSRGSHPGSPHWCGSPLAERASRTRRLDSKGMGEEGEIHGRSRQLSCPRSYSSMGVSRNEREAATEEGCGWLGGARRGEARAGQIKVAFWHLALAAVTPEISFVTIRWEAVSTSNHFQNHFQVTSAAVTRRGGQSRLLIGARGK
jgi:hypothetical protein